MMAICVAGIRWFRIVNEYRLTVVMNDWVSDTDSGFFGFHVREGHRRKYAAFGITGRIVEFDFEFKILKLNYWGFD